MKQLKEEARVASKTEDEKTKMKLRAKVVKNEQIFNDAIGSYRTQKKCAEDLAKFAREHNKEQLVS